MNLKNQRRIASQLLKVGSNKVWFDNNRLTEIKEAITKIDIRSLIRDKAIQARPTIGVSRVRARKRKLQKRKGRRQGEGTRKGKKTSRLPKKKKWMMKIRVQRNLLKMLKDKNMIQSATYRNLYRKAKGGFFRSKRHINLYIKEHDVVKEEKPKARKRSKQ